MRPEDTLALMTWRARPDTSCEYVNRAWLDYTGYTLEQSLGEGWSQCLHPEDLARWLDTCVRAFDTRKPFEIEYRLRRKDGEYRWVLDRAAPCISGDGVFLGYAGGCIDIEEHKRTEQSLSRALERERRLRVLTEESSRARLGMTLSVLQELQSPAQAIATWASHLHDQVPPATETARVLQAIERNARTQSRIIANLLDLSQVTARSSAMEEEKPLLGGVRVLVVDGDPDAREQLLRVLELAGADVRVAATTQEALGTLGAWQADVVLSEKNDGFIRALRALPAERGGCLRAAVLTADTRSALTAGYDAQLAKPVEPVALLATVARLAA